MFGGVWRYFFVSFSGRILDGWRCLKKNRSRHGKGGIIAHYCAIPPSQPAFIAYNIAQYIFPTTPFIAIKYWQYLVRAKPSKGQEAQKKKKKKTKKKKALTLTLNTNTGGERCFAKEFLCYLETSNNSCWIVAISIWENLTKNQIRVRVNPNPNPNRALYLPRFYSSGLAEMEMVVRGRRQTFYCMCCDSYIGKL